jgi:hypothetical protein
VNATMGGHLQDGWQCLRTLRFICCSKQCSRIGCRSSQHMSRHGDVSSAVSQNCALVEEVLHRWLYQFRATFTRRSQNCWMQLRMLLQCTRCIAHC